MEGGRRLAAWAIEGGARAGYYSLHLPSDRAPGAGERVAGAARALRLMRLRPDGTLGFLLLSSRMSGEHEVLEAISLGADGSLRGGPRVVAETPSDILWLEAVGTPRGALVVWAERNGEQADVYVAPVGLLGTEAPPRRVVRGALAWQVARFGAAAVLATVEASGAGRDVVLRFIGDDGQRALPDVVAARSISAELDLDLVVARGRTVLGYAERRGTERTLMLASLDASGALERPAAPATAPRGDQRLFGLYADPSGPDVFAVWEEARRRPLEGRRLELGVVDASGRIPEGPTASLLTEGGEPLLPMFTTAPSGLLVAANVALCEGSAVECARVEPRPQVLTLDRELAARGAAPLSLPALSNAPPDLVWDLTCEAKDCWALLAQAADPTPVFLQRIAPDALPQATLAPALLGPGLPHVLADRPVLGVPDLVDVEVERRPDGGTWVTWLSYFDPNTPYVRPSTPAPDGKREPVRAILRAEVLSGPDDAPPPEPARAATEKDTTISWRAHSLGGLSSAAGLAGERLYAWSALDGGRPQVFVTLVDASGKKVKQRMLTNGAEDVSDVAVARTPSGWLVAWVDVRGGRAEVRKVLVDGRLTTISPEQALASNTVGPTGLRLLTRGDRVLAAWSDARGASRVGYGDVYVASLDAKDGAVVVPAQKLQATELHSYALSFTERGEGATLGWIEGEPDVESSTSSSVSLVELDAAGRAAATPTRVTFPGRPSSLAVSCDAVCRVVVTLDTGRRSELWGLTFAGGTASEPVLLSVLKTPHAEAVRPELQGDSVYYVDALAGERRVIRRLDASWR